MTPTQSPEVAPNPTAATSPSSPSSTTKLFSCEFCTFTTHNAPSMKKHRARHTGEGMMRCGECSYQTIHPYLMKIHAATYHSGEGLINCPHCKFKSARRERYRHHLNIHIKSGEASPDALQIFNEKCAKETQEKRKAERVRIKEEARKKVTGTERLGAMRATPSPSTSRDSFKMDDDSSSSSSSFQSNRSALRIASDSSLNSFMHSNELKKHLVIHARDSLLVSGTSSSSNITDQENIAVMESSSNGLRPASTNSFVCNRCDFVSCNERLFLSHKLRHNQEIMFCEFCSFSSSDKTCMRVHNASHEGIRKALCPFCEFSSSSQLRLKRHVTSHSSSAGINYTDEIEDIGGSFREVNGGGLLSPDLQNDSLSVDIFNKNYKGFFSDQMSSSQKLSPHSKQNIYLQTSGVMFGEYSLTLP